MRGEEKDFTTVWLTLGQRTLRYETYVMPAPEENHGELYEHLLRRNEQLVGAHFSIGVEDAVFLRGELPLAVLDEDELDRVSARSTPTSSSSSGPPSASASPPASDVISPPVSGSAPAGAHPPPRSGTASRIGEVGVVRPGPSIPKGPSIDWLAPVTSPSHWSATCATSAISVLLTKASSRRNRAAR